MPKYFALTQEVLQEVLKHLTNDPAAALYEKVSQALPVQETPTVTPPETTEVDVTPASN
jgi:hypothetical protein